MAYFKIIILNHLINKLNSIYYKIIACAINIFCQEQQAPYVYLSGLSYIRKAKQILYADNT